MYRCDRCGEMFEEAENKQICFEVDAGVGTMFKDHHYGEIAICPHCGSDELEEFCCDEDCGFCSMYDSCTMPERKEVIDEFEA